MHAIHVHTYVTCVYMCIYIYIYSMGVLVRKLDNPRRSPTPVIQPPLIDTGGGNWRSTGYLDNDIRIYIYIYREREIDR